MQDFFHNKGLASPEQAPEGPRRVLEERLGRFRVAQNQWIDPRRADVRIVWTVSEAGSG